MDLMNKEDYLALNEKERSVYKLSLIRTKRISDFMTVLKFEVGEI